MSRPPSSPPPVAMIRHRRRRSVQLEAALGGIPLVSAALVVFLLLQPGTASRTVTVGPTTPPASMAPPSSLVAAGLGAGGTNDIAVISTATGTTSKTLASGMVLYSGSALATASDGSVYFASYSPSGVSEVSPAGTVTSVAPGSTRVAVSQDGRYIAAYKGPLAFDPNGPAPMIDVINRSSGQSRSLDLGQVLGPGYTVTGLAWASGTETVVADAEIVAPAPSCAASGIPGESNCPAPTPKKPVLVLIDAASTVLSPQVTELQSPVALVGTGPSPDAVVLEVSTSDPNADGTGSELVMAQLDGRSLSETPLAGLPSDVEALSLDPAGTHLLYLEGYSLGYATIAHSKLTRIRRIPGRYVTAAWSAPTQSEEKARPTGSSASTPGPPATGGGSGVSSSNPLFDVVRGVNVPSGATGLLYADGALFAWSHIGGTATNAVTRIDINRGRVTATANLDATGAAFADHVLWLTTYPSDANAPTGTAQVVGLDPTTLEVVHRVPIPAGRATGYDSHSIASAGGLVWAVGAGTLYGIDPSTATVVRRIPTPSPPATNGYQAPPGQYGIDIAAPPDGSVLWSAESPDGGGYDAIQVRNPVSGAIINSSTDSMGSIGNTTITAADSYAWLAYRTGMMGSYIQVRDRPGLPASPPPSPIGGSNATSVSLTADALWVYDRATHRSACADPTSGHTLQVATVPIGAVASLPNGQIAVTSVGSSGTRTIAIAEPTAACTSSSTNP